MDFPERYTEDLLLFFEGRPLELGLCEALTELFEREFPPELRAKVQKSQVSFCGRHLFAAVSLPLRRKRGWPEHFLLLTLGLGRRLESPRVAVAVEPYPGRWTHHILLTSESELDAEVRAWLHEAYDFAESKR